MPADATTFFLSFAAVFGALGWYLVHLDRHVTRLETELRDARAATAKNDETDAGDGA